jgi:formyl-CoA transferase
MSLARANLRIILMHISGYGRTGPYRNVPGFGTPAKAFSGFAYTNGQPDGPPTLPTPPSFPIADHVTALFGCQSVLAAVLERERSGRSQEIELDLYECLLAFMGNMVVNYEQLGEVMQRRGNRSRFSVPRNWLFRAIGRPDLADDPALATNRQRAVRAAEIDSIMTEWVAVRSQAQALAVLRTNEVAAGPINDIAQFVADPHVQARQTLREHLDPDLGMIRIPGVGPRFSRTPGAVRRTGWLAVGHDTHAVLDEAGYSAAGIERLATDGVIVPPDSTALPSTTPSPQ